MVWLWQQPVRKLRVFKKTFQQTNPKHLSVREGLNLLFGLGLCTVWSGLPCNVRFKAQFKMTHRP